MNIFFEVEDCFKKIEKHCKKRLLAELKCCPPEKIYLYHFGLGMWIRNNVITEESSVYKMFCTAGIERKDTMSRMLIEWFCIYLKNKK